MTHPQYRIASMPHTVPSTPATHTHEPSPSLEHSMSLSGVPSNDQSIDQSNGLSNAQSMSLPTALSDAQSHQLSNNQSFPQSTMTSTNLDMPSNLSDTSSSQSNNQHLSLEDDMYYSCQCNLECVTPSSPITLPVNQSSNQTQNQSKMFGLVLLTATGKQLKNFFDSQSNNQITDSMPLIVPINQLNNQTSHQATSQMTNPTTNQLHSSTVSDMRDMISNSFDYETLIHAGLFEPTADSIESNDYLFLSPSTNQPIDQSDEDDILAISLLPIARIVVPDLMSLASNHHVAHQNNQSINPSLEVDTQQSINEFIKTPTIATLKLINPITNRSNDALLSETRTDGPDSVQASSTTKSAFQSNNPPLAQQASDDEPDDDDSNAWSSSSSDSDSDSSVDRADAAIINIDSKRRRNRHSELRISVVGELTNRTNVPTMNDRSIIPPNKQPELPAQVGLVRHLCSVSDLLNSRFDSNYDNPSEPIWLSVENATAEDILSIGLHFDLHPLTVEDCQSKHTREKLEIFQHYLFLVFHALDASKESKKPKKRKRRQSNYHDESSEEESDDEQAASESSMRTAPIKLIVFPHLVLSFSSSSRFSTLSTVRLRLKKVYENRLESTAWIIHAVLDCIVDALLPVVDGTVLEVDALEDLIYVLSGSEHRDLLKRMGLTRRRLSFLRQRLWSKRDILMSLIGKDWQLFLAGVQIPYLRDVYDHVVTMLHKVEAGSELLGSLQNTYLANVSIDVADQSKESNEIMKQLSAVATIVLPLSLVAGIMGMNVQVPWQADSENVVENLIPFIVICVGMVVVSAVMIVYFKARNLI